MPTSKSKTPEAIPDQEETLELADLLSFFEDHAGSFQSFKMLQSMFNDHITAGLLQACSDEALQDFMYHFILISEVVFKLETQAANNRIKEIKAMATRMAS